MRRREFITLLGGAAAWVAPARAQEPRKVIGVLAGFGFPSLFSEVAMPAFLKGLKDAGFVEGRNINIEIRQVADGHYDRLPSLAAELVGHDVAAIFAADLPSAFAAKAATKTIPIVFASGADPVKVGLVDSLSRPKGNLTGVSVIIRTRKGPKPIVRTCRAARHLSSGPPNDGQPDRRTPILWKSRPPQSKTTECPTVAPFEAPTCVPLMIRRRAGI